MLSGEYFQLSKTSAVRQINGKRRSEQNSGSQTPSLGISLTLVSVLKTICQGTVVEKGSAWQSGPCWAFQGEHSAFPSAAPVDACKCITHTIPGENGIICWDRIVTCRSLSSTSYRKQLEFVRMLFKCRLKSSFSSNTRETSF